MKRNQETINKRHNEIIKMLQEKREMKVDEISEAFGISVMTARRDLQALEEKGLLTRFHGGARIRALSEATDLEAVRKYREAISAFAASLVGEKDSLFINGSMTAAGILRYLESPGVSVITNNACASGFSRPDGPQICLTGGLLREHIMVGDFCIRNLLSVQQDKAFLGCSGISPNGDILCDIPSELAINETMISHADAYFILADSTKLGRTESSGSFTLQLPGTVITDGHASPEIIQRLESQGMKVIQVSC